MIWYLLSLLWFLAPIGFANMAPVFAAKLPFVCNYSYPLDFYKKYKGKRVFGDHKTMRGIVSGIVLATIIAYLQQYVYNNSTFFHQVSLINYSLVNPMLFGVLSGIGALGGDAIKSFFKRQINIPSGKSWIPYDQLDYVVGGLLITSLYINVGLKNYIIMILLGFIFHILLSALGYYLKLKKTLI